jgi:hypothetical protein
VSSTPVVGWKSWWRLACSCEGDSERDMSKQASLAERLSRALTTPTHGVLGLVDELLAASSEQAIRLTWQAGRCRVDILRDSPDQVEVPVPKAVVRAVLARVAALCNERDGKSASPYGGSGEVTVDADPAKVIRVSFVNTPEEQRLELAPMRTEAIQPAKEQSLATHH